MLHSTLFTPHSVEDYFQQLWQSMNKVIDDIPAEEIEQAEPERLAAGGRPNVLCDLPSSR